jgi:hypothetical protein
MTRSSTEVSPIFVVGMQRSGTTLMRSLLSAHPNLTIAPETHFINRFVLGHGAAELHDEQEFLRFWREFVASDRFADLGIDGEEVKASVLRGGDHRFRAVFRAVLEAYAAKTGKARWGEKTPHHVDHVDTLLDWFPSARVVFMVRDPRAACASLLEVPWRQPKASRRPVDPIRFRRLRQAYFDSLYWQKKVDEFAGAWSVDPRMTTVRYEDLATSPDLTLRRLCEYLEEPFDELMLGGRSWDALSASPDQVRSWNRKHLESTLKPVNSASIAKWQKDLSPVEVAVIERNCASGMARLGYAPSPQKLPSGLRFHLVRAGCAGYWKVREMAR